jgi:hypothetical protein
MDHLTMIREENKHAEILLFPNLNNLPESESVAFGKRCGIYLPGHS